MEIKEKVVLIKPVKRPRFSGQSHYPNTGISFEGAQMSKDGTYKTGLTRQQEEEYCDILGLPKGTLSKNNDKYWGSMLNLRLPSDKPYRFPVNTLLDQIKLNVLLLNNRIAKNETEVTSMTDFYVDDLDAKAEVEEKTINLQMEAIDKLRDLTLKDKKGYLRLFGKKGVETLSESVINTALFKEANANPEKFISLYDNPDIKLRMKIEEMIETQVIKKKGNYYEFENEVLGTSIDSVVAFFKDVKNQSLKLAAQQESKEKIDKKNKK